VHALDDHAHPLERPQLGAKSVFGRAAGKQPRRLTLMWFQRNRLMVDWHAQRQLMATFEEDV
jgi:hypothetical protein